MKKGILLTLLALICGCSANRVPTNSQRSDPSPNALVEELRKRDAEPSSTAKLVFIGSEADVGWDTKVVVTDKRVIKAVWNSILNATEYGALSACGWRTIEFYSKQNSNTPMARLRVYCGGYDKGNVYIEGMDPWESGKGWLYICDGLHGIVMKHLQEEYDRRQKDSIP